MIKFDGINLPTHVKSLTINGAYVAATYETGERRNVRHIDQKDWFDAKHRAVVDAMHALEAALADIL